VSGRVLEIRGLIKSFAKRAGSRGDRIQVLGGVDLELAPGQGTAVLGANGSGKSTLLRTVAGLLLPDSGTVRVLGIDPTDCRARRSLGFASGDERSFLLHLTARENLEFFARLHGLDPARFRRAIEATALELELMGELDKTVHVLSTGARALFGVARALLHAPRLLVLDEPSRSLDAAHRELLGRSLTQRMERGAALLIATHDLELVRALGLKALRTESGRLGAERVGG
jgi:ABC-type multidrug transport system ATPase subunit